MKKQLLTLLLLAAGLSAGAYDVLPSDAISVDIPDAGKAVLQWDNPEDDSSQPYLEFWQASNLESISLDPFYTVTLETASRVVFLTTIHQNAFSFGVNDQTNDIKHVTLPISVTSMGESVFKSCSNLESVHLPDHLVAIPASTFYNCFKLTSVEMPKALTTIGESAFESCRILQTITIPGTVTTIEGSAFYNTGLTSVTIPASVTSIGDMAFAQCSSLRTMTFEGTVPPTIGSNVFFNVTATINVPEGAKAAYATALEKHGISASQIVDGTEGQEPEVPAAKQYVQVTSFDQMGAGGRYAVAGYNHTWTANNNAHHMFYTLNAAGEVELTPKSDAAASIDDSMVWELYRHEGIHCHGTNSAHLSHGPVFSLGKSVSGQMKYINHCGTGVDTDIPCKDTTKLTTVDSPTEPTMVEFVEATPPADCLVSNTYIIHTGYNSTNMYFQGVRVVKYTGNFDRGSRKNDASQFSTSYETTGSNLWSAYNLIYLEIDPAHPEQAASALWDARRTAAAENREDIADLIKAIAFPTEGVEWGANYDAIKDKVNEKWDAAYAALLRSLLPKTYAQITSREQLGQGGRYAIACVGSASDYPRYYTIGGTEVSQTVNGQKFAEGQTAPSTAMIWELERPTAKHVCTAGHAAPGSVFSLKHSGNYLNFGQEATTPSVNDNTIVEFVTSAVTSVNDVTGTYFTFHANWDPTRTMFQNSRGLQASTGSMTATKFGRPVESSPNLWDSYTDMTDHSTVHAVYIELDPNQPEVAAGALWDGKLEETVMRWAANVSETVEESLRANLPAIPSDVEWDVTSLTALQAQIDAEYAKIDWRALIAQAVSGNSYQLHNSGSNAYVVVTDSNATNPYVLNTEKAERPFLFEANAAGDAFTIRYSNGANYLAPMPNAGSLFTSVSAENAGEFVIDIVENGYDTGTMFIRAKGAAASGAVNMHGNIGQAGKLQAAAGTATGGYSQWTLELATPQDFYAEYRDDALARINAFHSSGILATADKDAAVAAINDIAWNADMSMSDAINQIDSKSAEVDAVYDRVWEAFTANPVIVKFHSADRYLNVNANGNLFQADEPSEKGIWVIERISGDQFYMSNRGEYINGTQMSTALSADAKAPMTFVFVSGKIMIANTTIESANNLLQGSGFNVNYASAGNDSHLDFVINATEVPQYSTMNSAIETAVNAVGSNYYTTVHMLNMYSKAKLDEMNEALAAYNDVTEIHEGMFDEIANILVKKDALLASKEALRDGMLIRLKASAQNPSYGKATLHYTTNKAPGNTWLTKVDAESATEENSIFYWKSVNGTEKLLTMYNGLYACDSNGSLGNQKQFSFSSSASANTGDQVRFIDATSQEAGAYQMVMKTDYNVHIHTDADKANNSDTYATLALCLNKCSVNYPALKDDAYKHNWNIEVVDEVPVTVNVANGVGSVMCPVALDVPEGCSAWVATMNGHSIGWNPATHIKANEHAVIYAPNHVGGKVKLAVSATQDVADDTDTHQHLRGHYIARTHSTTEFPKLYALNVGAANPASAPALYAADDETEEPVAMEMPTEVTLTRVTGTGNVAIPAGTLAVHVTSQQCDANELTLPLNDTVNLNEVNTSISEVSTDTAADGAVYDLQGRRLSKAVKGGVNIINGRKVFIAR